MDALTPAEALGSYNGLALSALIQQSLLVWVPRLTLVYHTIHMSYQFRNGVETAMNSLIRLGVSLGVLAMFWPGAVMSGGSRSIAPTEFISAAARSDGAPIQNAGQLPAGQRPPVTGSEVGIIPLAMVEAISESWLTLAVATRVQAFKPFSDTQPLEWLFSIDLSGASINAIRDFTEKCVLPAQRAVLETTTTVPTYRNMQPFASTPVSAALDDIVVMPGKGYSLLGAFSIFVGGRTSCNVYRDSVVTQVEAQLNGTTTPGGAAIPTVWEDEIGVGLIEAAEMLIWREIMRTGATVPHPSLRGIYATAVVSRIVTSSVGPAARGMMRGGPKGGAVGAGTAGAAGITDQLTAAAASIMSLVGPALLVTEFAPELLGMAMTVMLAAQSILLCYVIIPGRQAIVMPVMSYFVILALLYSSPFWWAVIELTSKTAAATALSVNEAPLLWAKAKVAGLLYQTLGIGVVIIGLAAVTSLAVGASGVSILRSLRRPL